MFYLLIGDLLFQYCMQIGLLMLGYALSWPVLFLGCVLMAGGGTVGDHCAVFGCLSTTGINLLSTYPPLFFCSIINGAELKLEVANADLNATNLVCF